MTNQEAMDRAKKITSGWRTIQIEVEWLGLPSLRPPQEYVTLGAGGVDLFTEKIAEAIQGAVAAEKDALAAEVRAYETEMSRRSQVAQAAGNDSGSRAYSLMAIAAHDIATGIEERP